MAETVSSKRPRRAEVAIEIVARMIQAHLQRAGYVIKRKPPREAHAAHPATRRT
jgi:hypothetical protein